MRSILPCWFLIAATYGALAGCEAAPNLLTGTSDPPLGELSPTPEASPAASGSPGLTSGQPTPQSLPLEDLLGNPPPLPSVTPLPNPPVSSLPPLPSVTPAAFPIAPIAPLPQAAPPPAPPALKAGVISTPAAGKISGAVPLAGAATGVFIDIRGVGDAGMANTYQQPLSPIFGARLDAFDRSGKSYRGDLSFINWETVVGTRCRKFRGTPSPSSYAFISHPSNLLQAYQRGFNLIGLANNHSRDCPVGANGGNGALESSQHMQQLSQSAGRWLWHGVGPQKATPQVKAMVFRGRSIRVAFGSLYLGGSCSYITCSQDRGRLLQAMRDVEADLRILSIHSWDRSTQQQLVQAGSDFIRNYKGDVVFGHGPHVWAPVTVLPSNSGRKGVMFESLGNFIHPNLAAKRRDMIGRVLLDLNTLQLRQVQAIPLQVNGASARFSGALAPTSIPTRNFTWQTIPNANWRSGISGVKGVYANF